MTPQLTPDILLKAYAVGIFPMAETRHADEVFWMDPEARGVFPLDRFHISRSLKRRIQRWPYEIRINTDFTGVVNGCAARDETWINGAIFKAYAQLHRMGYAHSLEVWSENQLVGGVYGIALGAGFFGESMFSRRTDASKVALAYLIDRLNQTGFCLFDTQFLTPHLASLGAIEITRSDYHQKLKIAVQKHADFTAADIPQPSGMLQRMSHTS